MAEMATVVDELFVALNLNTKGFSDGIKQADGILQNGLKGIMSKFVAPLSAALGGAKLFHDYTSVADNIGKLSASLGISGSELQAWGEAAARAGGSVSGLQGSVRTLQRQLSVAGAGGGQAAQKFAQMGISLTDANGKAKDAFEVMRDLAGVAEGMDKAKFVGLAQSLRLDQGTIQLLQQGRVGLDELIARQKELGTYTDEDFKLAGQFNDAWQDLKQAFTSVAAIVMRILLPPINKIIGKMTEFATFLRKNKTFVETFFKVAAVAITASLIPSLMKLKDAFGVVGGALKFTGLNSATLKWASLAAAIAGIALLVEDFIGYMNGKKSAFEKIWKVFGTPEEVKASVGKFMDICKGIGQTLLSWLPTITKIGVVFLPIFGVSKGLLAVYNGFKALKTIALVLIPVVKSLTAALMTNPLVWIAAAIAGLIAIVYYWDDIKEAAAKCWDWITEKWGAFADWIGNIWDNAMDSISNAWHGMIDKLLGFVPDWVKKMFGWDGGEIAVTENAAMPTGATQDSYNDWLTNYASAGMSWDDYQKQFAVAATPAGAAGATTINSDTDVKVGSITINTQATDAEGIAGDIGGALEDKMQSGYDPRQAQSGVNPV